MLIQPKYLDPTKPYGFTTSVYQAAILMLFNTNSSLTIKEIEEKANLSEKDLAFNLKDLFNPKQMVLKKDNFKTPKITPEENVRVNEDFKNPSLKINFIPKKSIVKENANDQTELGKSVDEEIRQERAFVLEAMIVKIMKARKTWQHTPLI